MHQNELLLFWLEEADANEVVLRRENGKLKDRMHNEKE